MKPVHILVVDDSDGDIFLITEALAEGKILNKVSIANDGQEALDFLQKKPPFEDQERPDLILLDVNMPKKNGHEVLKVIKADPELKTIPVVMLTTSAAEADINQSYQAHANCFITKPVELSDFMRVISNIENFWFSIVKLPIHP